VADVHQAGPLPPESDRVAARQVAFSATPVDLFPRSAAAADTMADFISTDQYLWGLRRVLDGISARRASTPTTSDGQTADGAGGSPEPSTPHNPG
jgi:hypothetical protein